MSNQTTKKNIHAGHRNRVRKKVLDNGFKQLEDHELLELLLFYSIPQGDTNNIAHNLINEFGNLANVFHATTKELMRVNGIGEVSAVQISAVGELCTRTINSEVLKKKSYKSNEEVIALIKTHFINVTQEKLLIACFDSAMRLKSIGFVGEGDSVSVTSELKHIVSKILDHDPVFVVMAHNHPQGSALPSGADIDATNTLSVLLRKFNIYLYDHVIVNPNSYYSMREDERYTSIFG
ncbi:MAG: RadC family protein [Clostridia bacterium]|nr:RadC family protein [Clostridia bacterium]